MKKIFFIILICLVPLAVYPQSGFRLASPDGRLEIEIGSTPHLTYSVKYDRADILLESPLNMTLDNSVVPGNNTIPRSHSYSRSDAVIAAQFYKKSHVRDKYNELKIVFRDNYGVIFRAYDDGVAYRFFTEMKKAYHVNHETVCYNFPHSPTGYIPYVREDRAESIESQFFNSFENLYTVSPLSEWKQDRLAFLPLLVELESGHKVCITEADLLDYPGMYLAGDRQEGSLEGVFPAVPRTTQQGGHNMLQGLVTSRQEYIARCEGKTHFPWRVMIVTDNDASLADNDMVYRLSTPFEGDYSWVEPGKVAWEWWNNWNLYGVDFRTGVNDQTYKYYIDFASRYGIRYVILDEGWSVNLAADLTKVIPSIDIPMLVEYARERNVGLILWAGYWAFERDMENICRHYSDMGIKGFKIDFMDRDDQLMVDFHRRAAATAAKYRLLVDFHGTYKPTGLHRTYPNVVNYEGVHGLEQMKWSGPEVDQITYDVTIPFIRMVAGPMDYTQGAMRNAVGESYHASYYEPMSQGTRCRQLAQYVIFESPLNMLCDSPTNYMREDECTRFISSIPTVWDRTVVLNGHVGKFVTIAREKDGIWYVGSMTGHDKMDMQLDLSFLGEGDFRAEIFRDGMNADKVGSDYKHCLEDIPDSRQMNIHMAPGGGFIMKITRI